MFLCRDPQSASHEQFIPHAHPLYQCRHTGKVMPPKRPNLILPSHVPHVELDILVRDGLDVEADGGDGGDVGVEL